jgi:hypothetical protein
MRFPLGIIYISKKYISVCIGFLREYNGKGSDTVSSKT